MEDNLRCSLAELDSVSKENLDLMDKVNQLQNKNSELEYDFTNQLQEESRRSSTLTEETAKIKE